MSASLLSGFRAYLRRNLAAGLLTSPFQASARAWVLLPAYAAVALAIGLGSGLLRWEPMLTAWAPVMLLALLVFPSLLEEGLFRGLLIPRQIRESGLFWTGLAIAGSTVLYVLWHPLTALMTETQERRLFLAPAFLAIVTLLGITCGHNYAVSKSLWGPILIHWMTVVVWVFLFGGHNTVLDGLGLTGNR
ncbi:type II CAAX prenyl endopeptidase Rce1 family protein [Marinobacter salicampi]|uniref:CPBP family glutamic-type intramembrane protease n=1 Tax=Marinobacter salicampi TaxID=435907 RepID=UPI00140724F0|nr:CPBP family glutamic-type intramembrane protease [Marinobacter salicampi]